MISAMTKYTFLLLNGDRNRFLEDLQGLGVVDIKRSSKPVDDVSGKIVVRIEELKERIKEISSGSDRQTEAIKTKLTELRKALSDAEPWGSFDKDALQRFDIKLYAVAKKSFNPEWKDNYALDIISEDGTKIYFAIAGSAEGFPLKEIPVPARTCVELKSEIQSLEKELESHISELTSRKVEIPQIQEKIQGLYSELSLYLAGTTGRKSVEDSIVIFEG